MPYGYAKWLVLPVFLLTAMETQAGIARTGPISILEIRLTDTQTLLCLAGAGYDVARIQGDVATVFATQEEFMRLRAEGFAPIEVGREPLAPKAPRGYHTYATLTTALQGHAAAYPAICRLYSLGKSVENRELWAVLITRNPDIEEDEPEFKYVATIHGNEPVGMENCVRFIDLLLTGYGNDERITNLIETTAIWVVPLMNPDGLERGTRYNAQGYDLNRNFPEFPGEFTTNVFDAPLPDTAGRPVEVARMMEWTAGRRFVSSANFHTGALVVNYPYDDDGKPSGQNSPTPDDALFRNISLRYSIENGPMWNSSQFKNGIVNGAVWYVISGGMQDWNYRYASCNEVTIELSNTFAPASSTLPVLWDNNREAMLAYLEAVHIGVRGIVTDRDTGEPLHARVRVRDNSHLVYTDPALGDYHRMLLPGKYDLIVSAPGYVPVGIADINVGEGPAVRADVALAGADINHDGGVNAADVQKMVNFLIGADTNCFCDVDGGEVSATDLQGIINAVLGRF